MSKYVAKGGTSAVSGSILEERNTKGAGSTLASTVLAGRRSAPVATQGAVTTRDSTTGQFVEATKRHTTSNTREVVKRYAVK